MSTQDLGKQDQFKFQLQSITVIQLLRLWLLNCTKRMIKFCFIFSVLLMRKMAGRIGYITTIYTYKALTEPTLKSAQWPGSRGGRVDEFV